MNDAALTCPKCSGPMMTYERAGIDIDQCQNCRGIFLDRGELERLMESEQRYYEQAAPPPAAGYPPPAPQPGYPQPGYPQPGYGQPGYYGHESEHHGHHGQHRRRGFMHDLFED